MTQKRKNKQPKAAGGGLHQAALELAADIGWTDLTLGEVHARAGLAAPADPAAPVWPVLLDILASLDAAVAMDVADRLGGSWRDDLFELLMTRFDLMQRHREAYTDVLPALLARPFPYGHRFARQFLSSLHATIDRAGLDLSPARLPLAVTTLAGIYLSLLDVWRQDDSADMAKTMAAIDKRLGWYEKIINTRF